MCTPTQEDKPDQVELLKLKLLCEPATYRDVEELLAERGLDISYETVRCWVLKFGP